MENIHVKLQHDANNYGEVIVFTMLVHHLHGWVLTKAMTIPLQPEGLRGKKNGSDQI